MKKITLAIVTAVSMVGVAFGQPNISIYAPVSNSNSQLRLPNGTSDHKFLRGCHLVRQTELGALTGSVVNGIRFGLLDGASPASTGNFTLWLENTTDATYTKGTTFATAIAPMTAYYTGTYAIPTSAAASTISFNFPSPFTYTGGGIYVAYAWDETSPAVNTNSTNPATYEANNVGNGNGLCATGYSSVAPAPTTMTLSDFRPSIIWNAVNTATNNVSVLSMTAIGKTTKLSGTGQVINALVQNVSNGPLTNIQVGLAIAGANNFTDSKTIANLAAGASTVVSFNPYTPTNNGASGMTVATLPDQNNDDNDVTWSQNVSCDTYAIPLALTAGSYTSSGYGAGANTGGIIYAFRMVAGTAPSSVTGVNCVVPSFANAANSGKLVYPVVCDNTGAIVATGKNVTIAASMMDVFFNYPFDSPVALTPGSTYYVGLGTTTNGYFPIGQANIFSDAFYQIPTGGGTPTFINYGYLSLEATLSYSNTTINLTSASTKTTACRADKILLTASGANTYTWNTSGTATTATTPTLITNFGTAAVTSYTVRGTNTSAGCPTNRATLTFSVSACTGLENNEAYGATIRAYPNPAVNTKVTVTGLQGTNNVTVYNVLGQSILNINSNEEEVVLDLNEYPAGNYMIKVSALNGTESKTLKVLTQH